MKRAKCCGYRRAASSANLEVSKTLGLKLGHGGDARRHEFQKRIRLGLGHVDILALVGDLTEIGLHAELGQAAEAFVEVGVDLVVGPGRTGQIVEKELRPWPWATTTSFTRIVSYS